MSWKTLTFSTSFYFLISSVSGTQEFNCTPIDYPSFVNQFLAVANPARFDPITQFLVPEYEFGCEGRISQWEVYTTGRDAHPVEFSVWRLESTFTSVFEFSIYRQVGSNYFSDVAPDENNLLSLPVPLEDQIEIQPGDIPGVRSLLLENTTISPFQIQLQSFGQSRVFFYQSNMTDQEVLAIQTSVVLGVGTPTLQITVNGNAGDLTPSETESSSTATDPDSDGSSSIAAIVAPAVVGGVGLSLAVTAALVTILCCLMRRNSQLKQTLEKCEAANSTTMSPNAAYQDFRRTDSAYDDNVYYSTIQN